MHYVPGFTNYLQSSVPRYANGGRVDYNEPYAASYMPAAGQSYVPGFTNYLETFVPPYAEPAQSMPAAQPTTQEVAPAAAPFDPSTIDYSALDLSGLGGLNFSGFGGGRMGGVIQDPNIQYIKAPISNKGNPTGKMGGNVFAITPNQPVRLVDLNTKTIVFEGTGPEAARKATELGQSITDARGRKASYDIQTADTAGKYVTVANEKRNKSTLGSIADVVGTVAPIALSFVPGFGQLSLLAKVAAAAGTGGLGAALKGDDILKGALLGGATAGIASGTGLDKALGGALGGLGKGAVTAGGQAAADATGDIVVKGLTKLAQSAGGAAANTLLSQGLKGGLSEVTGYKTPAEKFAQQQTSTTLQPPADMYAGVDPIDVLARRAGSGSPFGASFPVPVDAILSGALTAAQPTPTEQPKTAEPTEEEIAEILVSKSRPYLSPEALAALMATFGGAGALTAATAGGGGGAPTQQPTTAEPTDAEILVSKSRPYLSPEALAKIMAAGAVGTVAATAGGGAGTDPASTDANKKLGLEEYLRLAALAAGLVGGGGGKGGGSGGTYGGTGSGRLNPTFSAKLPAVGGLGNIGATRTPRALGDVDWLTYGTRPELSFFDYAPANPAPVTTPVPGNPAGPIITAKPLPDMYEPLDKGWLPPKEQILTPAQMEALEKQRIEQYAYLSQFTPTAEEIARNGVLYGNNEAADPIMTADEPRPMMAAGGMFAAKRGGPSRRSEFAVNGAGTGRSDDIPAVLSDGEYVIDAETVALLGDGSNKAGAKKLDELRIKVRKHKGKKLAKGRFSANAKRPEAYLSGGRI